jgi:hypothetical protein
MVSLRLIVSKASLLVLLNFGVVGTSVRKARANCRGSIFALGNMSLFETTYD